MAGFGAIKRSKRKVRRMERRADGSLPKFRHVKVDVVVARFGSKYGAEACVLKDRVPGGSMHPNWRYKNRNYGTKSHRCSGHHEGSTPTSAIRRALKRLGETLR